MHHALEIQEILFNIFGHCYPLDTRREESSLAELARTCRAFKEPALDVLWEELNTLSPLARCLPKASRVSCPESMSSKHSFTRPLTHLEWDVLRSYTRRIRSISVLDSCYELDRESMRTLSKPPTEEPVFLNLRHLYFEYTDKDIPLFLLPLPSLTSLDILLYDPDLFEESLQSFAKTSPNLESLSICPYHLAGIDMTKISLNLGCHWRNLRSVNCTKIPLNIDTVLYLSRMPTLTCLGFKLNSMWPDRITPSNSPLVFSSLENLSISSQSLSSVSRLLSQIRLFAVTIFCVAFEDRPSRHDLSTFLYGLQASVILHAIDELRVDQKYSVDHSYEPANLRPVLVMKDLRPCMAFNNLRRIAFNVEWKVGLTDSELVMLASAWPHLEMFMINTRWGWGPGGGITPNGLVQFLQKCPSMFRIELAIDTRGYTERTQSPASLELTFSDLIFVNVLDSFVEEESMSSIVTFFLSIAPSPYFALHSWKGLGMDRSDRDVPCDICWRRVERQVKEVVAQRS